MKKIILAFTIIALMTSCGGTADGFTINGTIDGDIADGTKVFLKTATNTQAIKEVDTTIVTEGKFTFTGTTPAVLDPYFIIIDKLRGQNLVFIENGTIEFKTHIDSLTQATTTGTHQNDLFNSFMKKSIEIGDKGNSVNIEYRKASQEKDTATVKALRDEMQEIQEESKAHQLEFAKNNPDAAISPLIINRLFSMRGINKDEAIELLDGLSDEIKKMSIVISMKESLVLQAPPVGPKTQ